MPRTVPPVLDIPRGPFTTPNETRTEKLLRMEVLVTKLSFSYHWPWRKVWRYYEFGQEALLAADDWLMDANKRWMKMWSRMRSRDDYPDDVLPALEGAYGRLTRETAAACTAVEEELKQTSANTIALEKLTWGGTKLRQAPLNRIDYGRELEPDRENVLGLKLPPPDWRYELFCCTERGDRPPVDEVLASV